MKQSSGATKIRLEKSPPARGRGLKPKNCKHLFASLNVAPRAGAWIETKK